MAADLISITYVGRPEIAPLVKLVSNGTINRLVTAGTITMSQANGFKKFIQDDAKEVEDGFDRAAVKWATMDEDVQEVLERGTRTALDRATAAIMAASCQIMLDVENSRRTKLVDYLRDFGASMAGQTQFPAIKLRFDKALLALNESIKVYETQVEQVTHRGPAAQDQGIFVLAGQCWKTDAPH